MIGSLGCSKAPVVEEPFRLHIIANSDAQKDQEVKLLVRDEILRITEEALSTSNSREETEAYFRENLETIEQAAGKILEQQGIEYGVKAKVGVYQFPEKTYADTVYPAGEYHALRIILGNGEGHNWWCVMFPPLCLVDMETMDSKQPVEVRSALWDWILGVISGGEQSENTLE